MLGMYINVPLSFNSKLYLLLLDLFCSFVYFFVFTFFSYVNSLTSDLTFTDFIILSDQFPRCFFSLSTFFSYFLFYQITSSLLYELKVKILCNGNKIFNKYLFSILQITYFYGHSFKQKICRLLYNKRSQYVMFIYMAPFVIQYL